MSILGERTALSIGGGCEDCPEGVVEDRLKVRVPLAGRRDLFMLRQYVESWQWGKKRNIGSRILGDVWVTI